MFAVTSHHTTRDDPERRKGYHSCNVHMQPTNKARKEGRAIQQGWDNCYMPCAPAVVGGEARPDLEAQGRVKEAGTDIFVSQALLPLCVSCTEQGVVTCITDHEAFDWICATATTTTSVSFTGRVTT